MMALKFNTTIEENAKARFGRFWEPVKVPRSLNTEQSRPRRAFSIVRGASMETHTQEVDVLPQEQLAVILARVRRELGEPELVLAGIVGVLERLEPRQVQRLRGRILVAIDDLVRDRTGGAR